MEFSKGDRVKLVRTTDTLTRLKPGDEGTVQSFRETLISGRTLHVAWDSGSTLSLLLDDGDEVVKI